MMRTTKVWAPCSRQQSPLDPKAPITKQEFLKAQIGSAHVTDAGVCIHDYSLMPCQAHGDCLGCAENVSRKGDGGHREKIQKRLELAEMQLFEAQGAQKEGVWGTDRWTQSHLAGIRRMEEMLAVHRDDSIADGTLINLPPMRQDNEIDMAVRDRDAASIAPEASNIAKEECGDNDAEMSALMSDMWD